MSKLIFLKLGGSVITNKNSANTADLERIDTLAQEIALALHEDSDLSLVIGHGSGSFGHHAANKYHTREGVHSEEDWRGFAEVAERARELNQIVVERLILAGLNAVSVSPFSGVHSKNHEIQTWELSIIKNCLKNHLIPVVYGDVVLDSDMGGTIFSTEELFDWLTQKMQPKRILLACQVDGVWEDYPHCTHLYPEINANTFSVNQEGLQSSGSVDVTGGMRSKVEIMVKLVRKNPGLEVEIFSGKKARNTYSALIGIQTGTVIRNLKG